MLSIHATNQAAAAATCNTHNIHVRTDETSSDCSEKNWPLFAQLKLNDHRWTITRKQLGNNKKMFCCDLTFSRWQGIAIAHMQVQKAMVQVNTHTRIITMFREEIYSVFSFPDKSVSSSAGEASVVDACSGAAAASFLLRRFMVARFCLHCMCSSFSSKLLMTFSC